MEHDKLVLNMLELEWAVLEYLHSSTNTYVCFAT